MSEEQEQPQPTHVYGAGFVLGVPGGNFANTSLYPDSEDEDLLQAEDLQVSHEITARVPHRRVVRRAVLAPPPEPLAQPAQQEAPSAQAEQPTAQPVQETQPAQPVQSVSQSNGG